jgi:hypothetical protein
VLGVGADMLRVWDFDSPKMLWELKKAPTQVWLRALYTPDGQGIFVHQGNAPPEVRNAATGGEHTNL